MDGLIMQIRSITEQEMKRAVKLGYTIEWAQEQYKPFKEFSDRIGLILHSYNEMVDRLNEIHVDIEDLVLKINSKSMCADDLVDVYEIPYNKFLKLKNAMAERKKLQLDMLPSIPQNDIAVKLRASKDLLQDLKPADNADPSYIEMYEKSLKLIFINAQLFVKREQDHKELTNDLPKLQTIYQETRIKINDLKEELQKIYEQEAEEAERAKQAVVPAVLPTTKVNEIKCNSVTTIQVSASSNKSTLPFSSPFVNSNQIQTISAADVQKNIEYLEKQIAEGNLKIAALEKQKAENAKNSIVNLPQGSPVVSQAQIQTAPNTRSNTPPSFFNAKKRIGQAPSYEVSAQEAEQAPIKSCCTIM